MSATCPAQSIILDLITVIAFVSRRISSATSHLSSILEVPDKLLSLMTALKAFVTC